MVATDNVHIYLVPMPYKVKECVVPDPDGYTMYINDGLLQEQQKEAYLHGLKHIENNDFTEGDVQKIEAMAH